MGLLPERRRDLEGAGEAPESGNAAERIASLLWRAEAERKAGDPFAWLGAQEVPEPPPAYRKPAGVAGLLALLVLVASGSFYVGMTFVPRWAGVKNDIHAELPAPDVAQPAAQPLPSPVAAPSFAANAPAAA
ncbi:MAG: hypothetical protein WCB02_23205, partial [Bradyrhizobium sp.]